ncbi:MAG: nitroreductase family protein, partial [Acidimicrobiales bacterium]
PGLVDRLVRSTLRAPTAGNTRGTAWVILEGREETTRYWLAATTDAWRSSSRRWPGLSRAPVVAVSLASPDSYMARYAEPDKAASGLGRPSPVPSAPASTGTRWPVPYWFADAAFCVHTLLLGLTAAGLGACFLGNFRLEDDLLAALEVPAGWRFFGAVALGYPDGDDHPSASLTRAGPAPATRVHRGRWHA